MSAPALGLLAFMSPRSIDTLLAHIFDYAGLFPPARLSMAEMVDRFAAHRAGGEAWMVGRVVVPLDRLGEFETTAAARLEREPAGSWADGWSISALLGSSSLDDLLADLERVRAFNSAHSATGRLRIDAVELRTPDVASVETALRALERAGGDLLAALEIPLSADPRGLIAAIAADEGPVVAKVRTGGVTPEAIPSPAALARFICACAASGAGFKATAGLHHPVRSEHPLTYERSAPRAVMHGFFNVLFAAAAALSGEASDADALAIVEETDPQTFEFDDQGAAWAGLRFDAQDLAVVRERLFLSIGSCSIEEPARDLQSLGLHKPAR